MLLLLLTSCFVPMDVSYPDVVYPLSVGSYPALWSICTQNNFYTKCFKTNINIYFTYPSNRKKIISNHMNIENSSFS